MRSKFAAKPRQIERSVDLPHQMIFGNRLAEMKLVEQLTWSLFTLQAAHHGSTSSRFASPQRNHAYPACLNRLLQQNRPISEVRQCPLSRRYWGQADIGAPTLSGRVYEYAP